MTPESFCALSRRLMQHPAVPYSEHAVRDEVEKICAEHGLRFERDAFGNLLVYSRSKPGRRPLVLAAHLDHPGFEIVERLSARSWLGRFRGGVSDAYFRPGTPLRLMPGRVKAVLGPRKYNLERIFEIRSTIPRESMPRFAVWDLQDFGADRQHIRGRACDDLIGAASVLATLIDLKLYRASTSVIGLLSRAEEVGFHGALAAAASGKFPKDSLIISLETSRELPGVKMGDGVILRVGDRVSIFDPMASRYLAEVAAGLKANASFSFQRGLMSGGTCEATAFQECGFQSAAVCVAVGNYHNCAERNRIKAEYVSLSDACGMVELLVAAARNMPQYSRLVSKLPKGLQRMLREARRKLRQTANHLSS